MEELSWNKIEAIHNECKHELDIKYILHKTGIKFFSAFIDIRTTFGFIDNKVRVKYLRSEELEPFPVYKIYMDAK